MATVHKRALANPSPILTCFQVVDWLSPSQLLTRKNHGGLILSDKRPCALLLLNGPVFVLRAACNLLIIHSEYFVITQRLLTCFVCFSLLRLSHVSFE